MLVAAAWGCGVLPAIEPGSADAPDDDLDGIADAVEDELMATFGPELRLAPDGIDWTRPASIEWYLERVHMRFDHGGCPDDVVLDVGFVTLDSIHTQQHQTKRGTLGLCRHRTGWDDLRASDQSVRQFFLQPDDDRQVHPGIPASRSTEWTAYVHVRPSRYVRDDGKRATYDLQVWYFFPYNDNLLAANHEGDWEHLTISLDEERDFVSAFFTGHGSGHRIEDRAQLNWIDGTHLVAYLADGSHATYASEGIHPDPFIDDVTYEGGPRWQTWRKFENIGERGRILSGHTWALYGGRWGEVGTRALTSGPQGPMFKAAWDYEP
jgi:hypothetical protein